jgi:GNAT superfamily N-acetyltransferase
MAQSGEAAALTVLAMRSKAHWGYDAEFMARAEPDLTVDPGDIDKGLVLVAEVAGGIAGFAGFERTSPGVFDVSGFFVAPEHIGTGVGRILFQAMAAHARQLGTADEPSRSLTILSDPNAKLFYLKMGARRIGEDTVAVTGRTLPLLAYAL